MDCPNTVTFWAVVLNLSYLRSYASVLFRISVPHPILHMPHTCQCASARQEKADASDGAGFASSEAEVRSGLCDSRCSSSSSCICVHALVCVCCCHCSHLCLLVCSQACHITSLCACGLARHRSMPAVQDASVSTPLHGCVCLASW